MRLAQQSSHPLQRVAVGFPMSEGVILRSPATLVELDHRACGEVCVRGSTT